MADPKYANLPGIAVDQPDVFETNELPESDQHYDGDFEADPSDSVETLHISANEAFGKFKGKHLDSSGVDFSDKVRRNNKKKGYISWSGEFELAGPDEEETLEQKYRRLNCEIRQLMDDMEDLKSKDSSEQNNLIGLAKQTQELQEQLNGLKLEEMLGSEPVRNLQDPRGAAKEKLLMQIQELKSSRVMKKQTKGEANKEGVIYELLMKPEAGKLEERQRLAILESRIEAIEKAVGSSPDKLSVLSVETNTKSVNGAISVLNSRLSLLDPAHLDHIEGRLAALLQRMNSVAEKKAQLPEDGDRANKISELYEMVNATQGMATALPDIVDRLDALQALHDQALQFSKALSQLDTVQQKLEVSLGNNQKVLQETKLKFAENLETIQKNFDNVDQRLAKLNK